MNKLNTPEFGIKIAAATVIAAAGAYFINKLDDTPVGNFFNDRAEITKLRTKQESEENLPYAEEFDDDNPLDSEYQTPDNESVDRDSALEPAEGPAEGLTEGPAEGPREGPAEGLTEGLTEGPAEGPAEGPREGPAEGVTEGLTEGLTEGPRDREVSSAVASVDREVSAPLPLTPPVNSGMRGGRRSTVCKHCHNKLHTRRKYK